MDCQKDAAKILILEINLKFFVIKLFCKNEIQCDFTKTLFRLQKTYRQHETRKYCHEK